jgi:hypothetical protein
MFSISSSEPKQLKALKDFKGTAICIVSLSSFLNAASCEEAIRTCMQTVNGPRIVLIVVSIKLCSANQITFCRQFVDKELSSIQESFNNNPMSKTILPSIMLLLHVPADQLHLRSSYQSIPLNGWSSHYVDSFRLNDDLSDEMEGRKSPVYTGPGGIES